MAKTAGAPVLTEIDRARDVANRDVNERLRRMLDIGLTGREQHWDPPLAGDDRPQAIRERREISLDETEDRRGRSVHVNVRVVLPVPDRLDVEKRPFNAADQHLPITAVAGRQRRRIDCGKRIERLVQPCGVLAWPSLVRSSISAS